MPVKTSNNVDMLDELQQINSMLAATGTAKPPEWDAWPKERKLQHIQNIQKGLQQTRNLTDVLDKNTNNEQKAVQDMAAQGVEPIDQSLNPVAKRAVFNLKKMGQMGLDPAAVTPPAPPAEAQPPAATPEASPDASQGADFSTVDGLKQAMNQIEAKSQETNQDPAAEAIQLIEDNFVNDNQMITDENGAPSDPRQLIRDAVRNFYATQDDAMRTKAATVLYEKILPDSVKGESAPTEDEVPGRLEKNVKPNLASIIQRSNEAIKKLAESDAKRDAGKFNLRKQAQHKALENVIMYGPEEKTEDQFTWNHEPISDWHLVERNKGFGLNLPGVHNVDWEKAWRENVMDKYTVPFRDKDGNWKGGYIEDRFEVDKNIPPQNNMQLKPGQLRKPVLPEYGNTESRLEAERTKLNKERGYEPAEKGEPFNWKKAQAKKKVTAEGDGGLKPLPPLGDSGSSKKINTEPTWTCPSCRDQMPSGGSTQKCEKCGQTVTPLQGPPQTGPDAPGSQKQTAGPAVTPGQMVAPAISPQQVRTLQRASVEASMLKNAVFFDGETQMFAVYAGTAQKKQFSSFDEAEKYAQSIPPRPIQPTVHREKLLRDVSPQPQPATAAPANPVAAPQKGKPQAPAAGRNPGKRNSVTEADMDGVGTDPRHHHSAHGLAIDG